MKSHACIYFKGNPIDTPLSITNIFKITVDQKEVRPKDVNFAEAETITLHCSTYSKHSMVALKVSELLAIEFTEDNDD